ncbi:MAG: acyltransferase family protein [Clostridia bacterium]|nr:acyltransferase family protein [Clostridia bacterium]
MEKKTVRIDYIDIMKGLGILLVVLGHLVSEKQHQLIYAFHMPLFYLLSGMTAKRSLSIKSIKKIFDSLYRPYVVIIAVDFLLMLILIKLQAEGSMKDLMIQSLKAVIGLGSTAINGPIWFLFSIMLIKLFYSFVAQIKNNTLFHIILTTVIVISVAFVFLQNYFTYDNRIIFFQTIPGMMFFGIGFYCKDVFQLVSKQYQKRKAFIIIAAVVLSGLFVFLTYLNGTVDMHRCMYAKPYLFICNALLGIAALFILSNFIDNAKFLNKIKKVLLFFGKNSIIILITHYYFTSFAYPILFKYINLQSLLYHPAVEVLLFVLTMQIMVPIIFLFNRYFGFLFGRKKTKVK